MKPYLVIIGPSGAGKSTLVQRLVARGLVELIPTWTTRPRRAEEAGTQTEHIFASDAEFDAAVADGRIAEAMELFGLPYRYGFPQLDQPPETVGLLMLRSFLMDRLAKYTTNYLVYHIERPSPVISEHLHQRAAAGVELGSRLDQLESELKLGRELAWRRFRNDGTIEELASEVAAAIKEDYRYV